MTRRSGSVSIGVGVLSVLGIALLLNRSMIEAKSVARIQDPPVVPSVAPPPSSPDALPAPDVQPPAEVSPSSPLMVTNDEPANVVAEAPVLPPLAEVSQDPPQLPAPSPDDVSLPPAAEASTPLSDPVAAAEDLVGRSLKEAEAALKALDKEKAELTERLQKVERGRSRYQAIVRALQESSGADAISGFSTDLGNRDVPLDQEPELVPLDDDGGLENPNQNRSGSARARDPFRAPSRPSQPSIRSRPLDPPPTDRPATVHDVKTEVPPEDLPDPDDQPEG